MRSRGQSNVWRIGAIVLGVIALIGGGAYFALNNLNNFNFGPPAPPEIEIPKEATPRPTSATDLAEVVTPTPTDARPPTPTASPTSAVPPGGIVYALSPDVNSVGWVQDGESGNHFGESYIYAGLRDSALHYGAMQFDLSFIPEGSTVFMAELELTGLVDEGLSKDSAFSVNILQADADPDWSRQNFQTLNNALVEEPLSPVLESTDLGRGQTNTFVLNATQRSIFEERLETGFISFRIDSLNPDEIGWFGWDSGYGDDSQGKGPTLQLGVLPPIPTPVSQEEVNEAVEDELAQLVASGLVVPTGTLVIITTTPTPESVFTAAAVAPTLTAEATLVGTPTSLPLNWVTPFAVTATPTPENAATALYRVAEVTAAAIAYGTATPTPANMVTATPTPTETATPIFILLDGELPPLTPTPLPSPTAGPIPAELIGKIAFKSDRTGEEEIYIINPDGSGLALLTNSWAYDLAVAADAYSPDGRFRTFTKDVIRYLGGSSDGLGPEFVREDVPAVFWYDAFYKVEEQAANFGQGIAYGGVWSPTREQIAFVSNSTGDDEIWVVDRDGSNLKQLTESNEVFNAQQIGKDTFIPEVNKHPSWSPDGNQIIFWSSRTGHPQIWVMDRDGANLHSLSRTDFSDYDPVWIKYPEVPRYGNQAVEPVYLDVEKRCTDFPTQAAAQNYFIRFGGNLDADGDGIACEELSGN